MPRRSFHNEACVDEDIDENVCDLVNEWMDEPCQENPGCSHREERHAPEDCLKIAVKTSKKELLTSKNPIKALKKAREAVKACQIHRTVDREYENCGCEPLYKEFENVELKLPQIGPLLGVTLREDGLDLKSPDGTKISLGKF